MKSKWLISLILIMMLSLSGCGNSAGKESEPLISEETDAEIESSELNNEDKTNTTETVETESVEADMEDTLFWEETGIKDGIATVYNGNTVELVRYGENSSCISGSYEFEKTEGFLQFAEINLSYGGAEVRLWVKEKGKARIELSGDYELEELYQFNDYGKGYKLMAGGKCILEFEADCDSASTVLEDCDVSYFKVYPTEGLVINGYEFKDMQMRNVVNNFGNPNIVSYTLDDDGNEEICYLYRKTDSDLHFSKEADGSYLVGTTKTSSELSFVTADGKNIESIDVFLALPEDDIRADEEKTIYQLGDKIEINQVYMSTNPDWKDVLADISLTVFGIKDDVLEGHVTISNPKSQDSGWIFFYAIQCSFLDENFNSVETTMGYNVALSDDGFDNGDFKDGDDCDIAFRMTNPDKIMYLQLGYNTPDGYNNILVKLK